MLDLKIKASRGLLEIEALDHTGKRVGTIYLKPEEVVANSMGGRGPAQPSTAKLTGATAAG